MKLKEFINKHAKLYMIVGIIMLLGTVGITYAYYSATVSNNTNVVGQAGGGEVPTLTIGMVSTEADGNLIPIDMDTTTLTKAASANPKCIDKNGYSACQIYSVTVTNNSDISQSYNITLSSLSGTNTPNVDAVSMGTSNNSVTDASSIKGKGNICTTNSVGKGETTNTCYFMVVIKNINSAQTDNGTFNGTVTATSTTGSEVKANFGDDIAVTPYTDFVYYLGSDNATVSTINYQKSDNSTTEVSLGSYPITLASNEVLLTQYIGTNPDVNVPDTYTINGNTYNVVMASYYGEEDYDENGALINFEFGIFRQNQIIENVILGDNIKLVATPGGMLSPVLNEVRVNDAYSLFYSCSNLVSATIPKNVNSMTSTFFGCTSLTKAPVLPTSLTNMDNTFSFCKKLVNVPAIPDSVTNMSYTFFICESLVNAPIIPSSVTNMTSTFDGCTNLTGTVRVNSSNVSNIMSVFYVTSKPITVEVPAGSTTYTTFSSADSYSMPSNVTLTTFTAD